MFVTGVQTCALPILYRVSTDKQVDFNSNHEADLPMQRKACHKFAEAKGWVIVHEEQEEGVSGHKVRAEARDKLQIIKEYARKGKFDILLVFMFDRIGRIADETPFVVEWFVRNGIRVWSTQEGEQRFDNHTDKLLNYIRFWQADGESEKTSDPYKLCATLKNLDYEVMQKITAIILFDDVHTATAWRILENYIRIPVEHIMIERIKQNKSLEIGRAHV